MTGRSEVLRGVDTDIHGRQSHHIQMAIVCTPL